MEYNSVENPLPWSTEWPNLYRCNGTLGTAAGSHTSDPPSGSVVIGPDDTHEVRRSGSHSHPKWGDKSFADVIMSPYSASTLRTVYHLARTRREFRNRFWFWYHDGNSCCSSFGDSGIHSWDQMRDFNVLLGQYGDPKVKSSFDESEVDDAIVTTQQNAYNRALTGIDLLTEIAEAKSSFDTINGVIGSAQGILQSFSNGVPKGYFGKISTMTTRQMRKSADKVIRKLSKKWLALQYGILPLVYTVESVAEEWADRARRYDSFHAEKGITPSSGIYIPTESYLLSEASGTIFVKSTYRVGYNIGALQRLATRMGFNPFVTAWELTTLSFVVDWFINVGDAIASATNINLSTYSKGCTSVRRNLVNTVRFVDQSIDNSGLTVYPDQPNDPCWPSMAQHNVNHIFERDDNQVVKIESVDSYQRETWDRARTDIVFDPHITWARAVTAFALSYSPTKKLLRRLYKRR